MLNKIIKTKSKIAFKSFAGIQKIYSYFWKSQKLNKKEKSSKSLKEKHKTKLAKNQPLLLAT